MFIAENLNTNAIMEISDEDEDVVIKGSCLYEHLHKLGYNDFESVAIEKLPPQNVVKLGIWQSMKSIFQKLSNIYLKIIQDDCFSKKQIETILSAKILLNDHGSTIHSFLEKYECKIWRTMGFQFILCGTVALSSLYIVYSTQYRNSINFFMLTGLCCTTYMQYLRMHAHTDLKSVVFQQNETFDLCRKGMRILKYGYKLKLSKEKDSQAFSDLTAGRLKCLQPIMEHLVKYLEHISCTYYYASLILINVLPVNVYYDGLLTKFDSTSFEIRGEINYQKLNTLYHTYILTQSEMLHILAIAYDNHIWRESYKKIPESRLAYIVRFIIIRLTKYKKKLSEAIDTYYNFKLEPMSYKYNGPQSSRWQDLYMHLYLASNKLQLSYGHILSILQDIDNDAIQDQTNENCLENIMQRLSVAQKSIETAKDFVEFSSIFLIKAKTRGNTKNHLETNVSASKIDSTVPVMNDFEPEIMDEVFEEYIKEEYLKPLTEETDELLYNYKRDKTLFKNFMTELKDALVDKQRSMSEREARALKRMYKTLMKETMSEDQQSCIPTPPPMPTNNSLSLKENDNDCNSAVKLKLYELYDKSNDTESLNKNKIILRRHSLDNTSMEENAPFTAVALSINKEFSSFMPPPFLKAEEETFIGSGENSEIDQIEDTKTDEVQ